MPGIDQLRTAGGFHQAMKQSMTYRNERSCEFGISNLGLGIQRYSPVRIAGRVSSDVFLCNTTTWEGMRGEESGRTNPG